MQSDEEPAPAQAGTGGSTSSAEYERFFRENYRDLIRVAMYIGAKKEQAEDAVSSALVEMMPRWIHIREPQHWARRAVVSNFLRQKTRSYERLRRMQEGTGHATEESAMDHRLTVWEDQQWVMQLLGELSVAQREVMAFIIDGLSPQEISRVLGKSPEAVRRNLCDARKRLKLHLSQDGAGQTVTAPKGMAQ